MFSLGSATHTSSAFATERADLKEYGSPGGGTVKLKYPFLVKRIPPSCLSRKIKARKHASLTVKGEQHWIGIDLDASQVAAAYHIGANTYVVGDRGGACDVNIGYSS